ncbi:MAG: hypothetical protein ACYTG0_15435 [Planctomycetota bacterium]|jgi:hypothetical protein
MKPHTIALSIVICLGVFLAAELSARNAESGATSGTMARWQHLALSHDTKKGVSDQDLNRRIIQLGNEGWELVDIENVTKNGTTITTVFFFKRSR